MTGLLGNEAGYHAILKCDTLLLLGADFAWRQFYPDKATIIQVDTEPTHLGQRHPVTLGVTGDIAPTVEALLPRIEQRTGSAFYDEAVSHHREIVADNNAKAALPGKAGESRQVPGRPHRQTRRSGRHPLLR